MPVPVRRALLAAAALLLAAHAPARAQLVPGGEPSNVRAHRLAFLAEVFPGVDRAVGQWKAAWEADNVDRLIAFYTEDAAFFPSRGEVSQGRRAVRDRMTKLLPVAAGLRTTYLDFTASGDMAVYSARFTYLVHEPGQEPRTEEGTLMLVLHKSERGWMVRSHLEQAILPMPAGPSSAATAADAAPQPGS